jgi:uncharacterized damage-inducible protein DinB
MGTGHVLLDLARHNAWATTQVIDFCRNLDDETLNTPVAGTYGTIMTTLRHYIDAEMSYVFRLTGHWPERPWQAGEPVGFDVLTERAAMLVAAWESYLAGEVDVADDLEQLGEARGGNGEVFATKKGIFLTQAIHHGSEHRAQICTILGTLGFDPPDVSGWGYALATGRSVLDHIEERVP